MLGRQTGGHRSSGTWLPYSLIAVLSALAPVPAQAGGPRFVAGNGQWVQAGTAETWNTTQLLYFTDPGDLSGSVTHAQADAMVSAAAAVWNVPTSSIGLMQGGTLAEHVSSTNSYFDGTGFSFPADVMTADESAVPVPVIYDSDGSVTELLLGSGASAPAECRQNAVTESVDDIQPDGHIHHAMLVLNGRCAGSAPQQLTQMQYQLTRAFGRVLGLSWSQANDNVFTAVAQVTADQEAYWPLMHPLDVVCGLYTYQCMPNPFSLRVDDLNSLETLYPVPFGNVPSGKQPSDADAVYLWTNLTFPNGQGMDWVNFVAHRQHGGVMDDYQLAASVTGTRFQQALSTPVNGAAAVNTGDYFSSDEGFVSFRSLPVTGLSDVYLVSEPINPLYWGEYALGPYVRSPVTPSGSSQSWVAWSALPDGDTPVGVGITAYDAASSCGSGEDGTEEQPATLDASGWQPGVLCNWGHSSWWAATVPAGRTWAFEVTATDEDGQAVTSKAATVFGMWNAADPTGTSPTVASAPVPFNSMALGVTQAQMGAYDTDTALRFAVNDLYGAGRPDFTYTARLLCIGVASPASVGDSGGIVTITGTGFRPGVVLYVNGVATTVTSVQSTVLAASVPAASVAGATVGVPVSLEVVDTTTGASSSVQNGLTYIEEADVLRLISAPGTLETGFRSATPFAVQVLASDGLTPLPGATVAFTASAGMASFVGCSSADSCSAVTDEQGIASMYVSGSSPGTVTLVATEQQQRPPGTAPSVQLTLQDVQAQLSAVIPTASVYVAAGASGSWTVQLQALHDGVAASGVPVTWTSTQGVNIESDSLQTDAAGVGQVTLSAASVPAGQVLTVTGCVWESICAAWSLHGVDPSQWQVQVGPGGVQDGVVGAVLQPITLRATDTLGHALQGAPISVYQRVLGWEGSCTGAERCPAAPVLKAEESTSISGADGSLQVVPLEIMGVPETVQIAASSGDQGFATTTLTLAPAAAP